MKRIDFLYFNAGGGHRSAATALEAVIRQQERPWQVRLVNVNDVLLSTDIFKKWFGMGLEDLYNLMLAKGWTLGATWLLPVMHGFIRLFHSSEVRLMADFWRKDTPDMVVSLIPNFNRALLEALRRNSDSAPFVTVITDLADYPPHFWMERQEQYVVCGTAKAVEQARTMGFAADRVFRTSGMILRPHFYEVAPIDRAAERARIGLRPDLPTGMVLFGGQGAGVMEEIARRLAGCGRDMQLILICGHNEKLAARLRAMRTKMPMHVVGFTREIPYYLQLADFFIGKPGPGSVSEALAMRVPVIVERNAWTLPQERFNADWILENGYGMVLPNFREIGEAVGRLLHPGTLDGYRDRVAKYENRAVFEIPDFLAAILGN